MRISMLAAALCAGLLMAATSAAFAQPAQITQRTLLDRIQIEDLITSYYNDVEAGGANAYPNYYTDDAEFVVNGTVYRGRDAIVAYHQALAARSPTHIGTFHMVFNNLQVEVRGAAATARLIWSGILSERVEAPARILKHGRETDELVKRDGQWRISRRTIITDAGSAY
ncbi:MAG: nuclear transport factor 2 family protein [Hyphomonadaceae bacterium]|nr:nuclear transport factor 2 family protein [Hyphomonadaceae bacterium]